MDRMIEERIPISSDKRIVYSQVLVREAAIDLPFVTELLYLCIAVRCDFQYRQRYQKTFPERSDRLLRRQPSQNSTMCSRSRCQRLFIHGFASAGEAG